MVRVSEWVYAAYFFYVAALAAVTRPAVMPRTVLVAAGIACVIAVFARVSRESWLFAGMRDWLPILYTLIAYREMDLFTPAARDYHFELRWIQWDRTLLDAWGLRRAIESLGPLLPGYLELCYALVYGTAAISIGVFYFFELRPRIDRVVTVYAVGTLLSYALFPYFPSDPPRVVFPGADAPSVTTIFREFNLFLVGNYGIHSSVFPSAHVSSAFAAGWGLLLFLPERRWVGGLMLVYAASVSMATIYGRYHYAADALGGAGIGIIALAVAVVLRRHHLSMSR